METSFRVAISMSRIEHTDLTHRRRQCYPLDRDLDVLQISTLNRLKHIQHFHFAIEYSSINCLEMYKISNNNKHF